MHIADFDYELPDDRIAQTPIEPRDAARLLVDRGSADPEHRRVRDLPELLREGDLLVLNEAPFDAWFAREPEFDPDTWRTAVERNRQAVEGLALECAVIGTMPLDHDGRRHQRSFCWSPTAGLEPWRFKAYLPDEEDVWEASWYEPKPDEPDVREIAGAQVGTALENELLRRQLTADRVQLPETV